MTPDRWERLKELFHEALERRPEEVPSFVDGLEGEDADLRKTLLSLLAAHRDDGFLESPAALLTDPDGPDAPPERVGPYAIVREIGRGGMGAVYLAARADAEFEKKVAVKLVQTGLGGSLLRERFRAERQILARLDHPGIARLLDGGTTPDGVPWVAMEYVEGRSITEHCEGLGLSVPERLRLFAKACEAVQYAHQNLVVHRDLKPANVLVTADGAPKLLDFGIAKLLDPRAGMVAAETVATLRIMTPDYASPEQLLGEPVAVLSDVYSLGVLLYELLAGRRPYTLSGRSASEVERVLSAPPPAPGSVRKVPRDLDAIVAKAMRREPRERYGSAGLLAEDVERFLDGEPVAARRGGASYRLRRFAARHKAGVAAAVLVGLSLAAGGAATVREARIAERERAKAEKRSADVRRLSNALLFDIYDTVEKLPGSLPARQALVKKALEYLGSLAKDAEGDPGLMRDLASAYQKVGEIQGYPYHPNVGDTAGCLRSLRTSLRMREELVARGFGGLDVERERNASLDEIGDVLAWTGDTSGGLAMLRRTQEARAAIALRYPQEPKVRRDVAVSALKIGDVLWKGGDRKGAAESFAASRAILEEIAGRGPDDRRAMRDAQTIRGKVAALLLETGDLAGATASLEASIGADRAWLARQPHDGSVQRDLEIALNRLGACRLEAKAPAEAVAAYREAHSLAAALSAAAPNDAQALDDLAYTRVRLGVALAADGDEPAALESFRGADAVCGKLLEKDPKDRFARSERAKLLGEQGALLARLGDRAGAESSLRRSLALCQELVAADPKTLFYAELLRKAQEELAALGRKGRPKG